MLCFHFLISLLVLLSKLSISTQEYTWDGTDWQWQEAPEILGTDAEGSGNSYDARPDDEDESEGSGESNYDKNDIDNDRGEYFSEDTGLINVDGEVDPRDLDIGFDDPPLDPLTPSPSPPTSTTPRDPQKHHKQTETNFFAQPGILAAVVGGTVVGLLCTILLVMLIVYRMRKADEGSYALNEPQRSPNVNSYLKAPTREFFA